MARNIYLTEQSVDVVDDVIDIINDKLGIRLTTKEFVEELLQDPEPLSQLILYNIKRRIGDMGELDLTPLLNRQKFRS